MSGHPNLVWNTEPEMYWGPSIAFEKLSLCYPTLKWIDVFFRSSKSPPSPSPCLTPTPGLNPLTYSTNISLSLSLVRIYVLHRNNSVTRNSSFSLLQVNLDKGQNGSKKEEIWCRRGFQLHDEETGTEETATDTEGLCLNLQIVLSWLFHGSVCMIFSL